MPLNSPINQFEHLELLARQVVEGFIIGLHKSPFHGFSVEFAEHRLYNSGDAIKNIDWKVFGRTDKLFAKKYEEETNLRCQIVIDASGSMYFPKERPKEALSKLQFACLATACLQYLLKKQRDAAGLSVFNSKVVFQSDAKSSTVHHQRIANELEKLYLSEPTQTESDVTGSLHQIAESIHKRSMVIVFSDFLDSATTNNQDALFSALQHLRHNNHEVIVFDLVDKKMELDFNFENRPYEFVDMETGEKLKLHAQEVKEHYVQQMKSYKSTLKQKCGQYKIDFIEADIQEGLEAILLPYFLKRIAKI